MIVHFIASEFDVVRDIEVLRHIVGLLHAQEYSLARDWIEPAYARRLKGQTFTSEEWAVICKESIDAITQADVIVAEASHESFSIGYQVAFAMQQKKPILLLHRRGAAKDVFVMGLKGPHVLHCDYVQRTDLDDIITTFLKENKLENKDLRFNFFIDRQIYSYLRWASDRSGKTKAEILRELVQREIDKHSHS